MKIFLSMNFAIWVLVGSHAFAQVNPAAIRVDKPAHKTEPKTESPQAKKLDNGAVGISNDTLPTGSYKESCTDIRIKVQEVAGINENRLLATCQRRNGSWVRNSLNIENCITLDTVSNKDGELVCHPEGSYRQTCSGIRIDKKNDRMSAQCIGRANLLGQSQESVSSLESVSTCRRGTIQNLDGLLACDRR